MNPSSTSMGLAYYVGDKLQSVLTFDPPARMPEPGDVYEFVRGGVTLGGDTFVKGDLLVLNCRTSQRPFNHRCSHGNWVVSHNLKGTKVSIWSGIELMLVDGDIKLVAVQ